MAIPRLAIAATLMPLFTGCTTLPPAPPLPEEYRLPTKKECEVAAPDCEIDVQPWLSQWVPDQIISEKGQKLDFKIKFLGYAFADDEIGGIVFKEADVNKIIPCKNQGTKHVKCDNQGAPKTEYRYSVRIKTWWGKIETYDPFVWNR